jgi:hypothetical protein
MQRKNAIGDSMFTHAMFVGGGDGDPRSARNERRQHVRCHWPTDQERRKRAEPLRLLAVELEQLPQAIRVAAVLDVLTSHE